MTSLISYSAEARNKVLCLSTLRRVLMACDLEIKLDDPKKVYTCGDLIQGEAVVNLSSETIIKDIIIEHQCNTKVSFMGRDSSTKDSMTLLSAPILLYPERELTEQGMSNMTLSGGEHRYRFEFAVPGDGSSRVISPSFDFSNDFSSANIEHVLKLTARRGTLLAPAASTQVEVLVSTCVDQQSSCDSSVRTLRKKAEVKRNSLGSIFNSKKDTDVSLEVHFYVPLNIKLPLGKESQMGLNIYLNASSLQHEVELLDYRVFITVNLTYRARPDRKNSINRQEQIGFGRGILKQVVGLSNPLKLTFHEQNDDTVWCDGSEVLNGCTVYDPFVSPKFKSELVQVNHSVAVSMVFRVGRTKAQVEMSVPVNVVTDAVHSHAPVARGCEEALPTYNDALNEEAPPAADGAPGVLRAPGVDSVTRADEAPRGLQSNSTHTPAPLADLVQYNNMNLFM